MCMCANLEGQYHDESMSAPVDVWGGTPMLRARRLATAQHLCGALVGLVNPGLVGISLEEKSITKVTQLSSGQSDKIK